MNGPPKGLVTQALVAAIERMQAEVDQPHPGLKDWDRLMDVLYAMVCGHEFESKEVGGDPTEASSTERVSVCKHCGLEL